MRQGTETEKLIARYLLGELSEEENARIEEEFFSNNEYFDQLMVTEDALIDDYVGGRLSEPEKQQLEGLLHSSSRMWQEVEFTRELIKGVTAARLDASVPATKNEHELQGSKLSRWLMSLGGLLKLELPRGLGLLPSATLLTVVLLGAVVMWNWGLQRRIRQLDIEKTAIKKTELEVGRQIEEQNTRNRDLVSELESQRASLDEVERELAELQKAKGAPSHADVATILLTPGVVTKGGGAAKTVRITPDTHRLRIEVEVGGGDRYKTFGVVVKTFDGRRIWARDTVRPMSSGKIVLTVPAELFANDDYTLTLKVRSETGEGVDIEDYPFRVRR